MTNETFLRLKYINGLAVTREQAPASAERDVGGEQTMINKENLLDGTPRIVQIVL